ncbi:hypothetical protein ACOSQ4_021449 [Xanthoceras sorbifolium]
MDKDNDYVSIDFKKLADSLRGEFATLYPLFKDCCIYRVPPNIRMLKKVFALQKCKELKAMEEHKLRYLQQFLQQTRISIGDFLMFIKGKEENLRNCYAKTIKFGSEDFVKMVLLDVVFVIEILLRYNPGFDSVDQIFTIPGMIKEIMFDFTSLENQLPIFILKCWFKLANSAFPELYNGYSLSQFTRCPFKYIGEAILIHETLLQSYFSKARHFVDLVRLCLQPPKRDDTKRQADSEDAPSVTKLHLSRVKFVLASTDKNLLDIRFNKGTLEILKLALGNMTVHLLRNLQIFEILHCGTNYINDFDMILNCLLSDPKNIELLTQNGVIENQILNSEGVSTLFRQLSRDAKDLKDYYISPSHKRKANLKQNYFINTPWASISVGATACILILTFIQTLCSIIGLK